MSDRVQVGVVGLGYRAPSLARNCNSLPESQLSWCCDASAAARERTASVLPGMHITDRLERSRCS